MGVYVRTYIGTYPVLKVCSPKHVFWLCQLPRVIVRWCVGTIGQLYKSCHRPDLGRKQYTQPFSVLGQTRLLYIQAQQNLGVYRIYTMITILDGATSFNQPLA